MPSRLVLPEILKELYSGGVDPKAITVVFSLGSHRKHTEDEKKYLVGEEIYSKIKCLDSDAKDFVNLGRTTKGTPDNAKHAVKNGGIIILVASCKEGFGDDVFESWMLNSNSSFQMPPSQASLIAISASL